MLTTMVENWPGFRDGIMGPDLMVEMRAQAERFGTDVLAGNVMSVDLRNRPFTIALSDGNQSRPMRSSSPRAPRRWLEIGADRKLSGHGVSVRDVRRILLPRPAHRGGRRRRFCDGRGDIPHTVRVKGHGRSSTRQPPGVEDHAGQGLANPKIEFVWDSEIADITDVEKGKSPGSSSAT